MMLHEMGILQATAAKKMQDAAIIGDDNPYSRSSKMQMQQSDDLQWMHAESSKRQGHADTGQTM